jgi:hypothetical protein
MMTMGWSTNLIPLLACYSALSLGDFRSLNRLQFIKEDNEDLYVENIENI